MLSQGLTEGRLLAQSVRFSRDTLRSGADGDPALFRKARGLYAQSDLEISESLTPDLERCLRRAYQSLKLPASAVQAFVYASPEIQAQCLATTESECVVRFSSSMVELLDDLEISFVAGHELGHFLLDHQGAIRSTNPDSLEYFMHVRYQEISADRVGLIACGSLDKAVRSLMKISSGLSEKHLRFDVTAFLDQLRHVQAGDHVGGVTATHPSVLVRARALLWFSMSDLFKSGPASASGADTGKLDELIATDVARYVDGSVRRVLDDARHSLLIWMVADYVTRDGVFRRREQQAAEDLLGEEASEGLRRFLGGLDNATVVREVEARLTEASNELRSLIPNAFESEYSEIQLEVSTRLGDGSIARESQ